MIANVKCLVVVVPVLIVDECHCVSFSVKNDIGQEKVIVAEDKRTAAVRKSALQVSNLLLQLGLGWDLALCITEIVNNCQL